MKKAFLLLALVVLATSVLSGCNGVADNWNDRVTRYRHINEWNCRQAADDVDELLLMDKASSLSRYQPRAGF